MEVATVVGATTHTDTALVNDTTYRYTLVAVDTHGNRSVSSAAVTAKPVMVEPSSSGRGPDGPDGVVPSTRAPSLVAAPGECPDMTPSSAGHTRSGRAATSIECSSTKGKSAIGGQS